MKQVFFVLITILSCLTVAQAQRFTSGSLVTAEGDTLRGLTSLTGFESVYFKKEKNSAHTIYKCKDLKYMTIDSVEYKIAVVEALRGHFPEKVRAVLEIKVNGPVQLLEYNGKDIYGGVHTNLFVQHGEQVPFRVPQKARAFRRDMSHYFSECESISQRIRDNSLGFGDLDQIVRTFNDWINKSE